METLNLDKLRNQLDEIDQQILQLFRRRMETVQAVAAYKKAKGLPVFQGQREREILNRAAEQAGPELEDAAHILYATLLDLSRSSQNRILTAPGPLSEKIRKAMAETPNLFPKHSLVACQGVEGAYSQQACDKFFPAANILYFRNFEGVFQAVEQGLCPYGVLPIENSTHGTVDEVYDLMQRYACYIVRSIKLKIDHVLLTPPGVSLEDVREVFSHEQAIGQCSEFLKAHPNIKVTVCENTAAAAKMVAASGRKDCASISSRCCASLYGLHAAAENIQNSDRNYTRFLCISRKLEIYPGANRISLMMALPHKPGALYAVIAKFSALGVNLTKLESRPVPGSDFEFRFYFDMEASVCSPSVLSLLDELAAGAEQFVFLGSYSEG